MDEAATSSLLSRSLSIKDVQLLLSLSLSDKRFLVSLSLSSSSFSSSPFFPLYSACLSFFGRCSSRKHGEEVDELSLSLCRKKHPGSSSDKNNATIVPSSLQYSSLSLSPKRKRETKHKGRGKKKRKEFSVKRSRMLFRFVFLSLFK